MQSIIDMFQNLEFQTEKLWHDFSNQYAPRQKQLIDDKKKKFIESCTEGEDEDMKLRLKSQRSSYVYDDRQPKKQMSACQRFWHNLWEQLELGTDYPTVDEEDVKNFQQDEESSIEEGFNKRQQKQLRKSIR